MKLNHLLILTTLFFTPTAYSFSPLIPVDVLREGRKMATVKVEVADTFRKRTMGLMFRSTLPKNQGMFFSGQRFKGFWMKNTLISLDILFINEHHQIIRIVDNALPCVTELCPIYWAPRNIRHVLELNAGWAKAHRVHLYDTIDIDF